MKTPETTLVPGAYSPIEEGPTVVPSPSLLTDEEILAAVKPLRGAALLAGLSLADETLLIAHKIERMVRTKPISILVKIEGGAMQDVWADVPNVDVLLRDIDNIDAGDEDPCSDTDIDTEYPFVVW